MYILVLVMSSFIFQPKYFSVITFDTREHCVQALIEAKKQWATINSQSKCINLDLQQKINEKQQELEELKAFKELRGE